MDLVSKYVMKDKKKEDIFHSSAYGKAQNKNAIGAASAESFGERMQVEHNRCIVGKYGDSQIISTAQAQAPHAKKYVAPKEKKVLKNKSAAKSSVGGGIQKTTEKTFSPSIKPDFGK